MVAMVAGLTACTSMTGVGDTDPQVNVRPDGVWEVTLDVGETATLDGVGVWFIRVSEDSRCPTDVQCVQAGDGVVELAIRGSLGDVEHVRLNTTEEPRSLTRHGLEIRLVDLLPYPVSTGSIDPADYTLELEVEPAGIR
jgi:hypothetical protein